MIPGSWAKCAPTKFATQFNPIDKDYVVIQRSMMEKARKLWEGAVNVRKYGLHENGNEFVSRFEEATMKDPFLHEVTQGDVVVFKDYMGEFNQQVGKGFGVDSAFIDFKLLADKVRYLPGGATLGEEIKQVPAFQRRHLQKATVALDDIQVSMKKLTKSFGVDMKELTDLEVSYAMIDGTANPGAKAKAKDNLVNYLGTLDSKTTKSAAGELYLGLNDILAGKDPASMMKTVEGRRVPWTAQEQGNASRIQRNFIGLRKDMLGVALNALRYQKQNAVAIDKLEGGRRGLTKFVEQIEGQIKQLELTLKQPVKSRKEGEITGIDTDYMYLEKGRRTWMETQEGYVPHHILRTVELLKDFGEYMMWIHMEMQLKQI